MPIIGISLSAEREYQSRFDPAKDTPEATVFSLGTLDSRVFGKLRDMATTIQVDPSRPEDEVSTTVNLNEINYATVQFGLKGWRNFRDATGNDIPFKTTRRAVGGSTYHVVDNDTLKRLPAAVISELADEIRRDNELTESAAKN